MPQDISEEQTNNISNVEEPDEIEEKEELDEPLKVLEPKPIEEVKEVIKTKTSNLEDDIGKLRLTYVETAAGGSSGIDGSTWTDWDVSSYVPAGAVRVEISLQNRVDAEYIIGLRENGSALERLIYVGNNSQFVMTVNLDNDRIIERYSDNSNVIFAVRGYYK